MKTRIDFVTNSIVLSRKGSPAEAQKEAALKFVEEIQLLSARQSMPDFRDNFLQIKHFIYTYLGGN